MPLYEYECTACHHRFEKIESFSSPDNHACPVCGKKAERTLAAPAFQFKGSGWYVTDYGRGSSSRSAPKTESPADKSTTNKSTDKGLSEKGIKD